MNLKSGLTGFINVVKSNRILSYFFCTFSLDGKSTKKIKTKKSCLTHMLLTPAFWSGQRAGVQTLFEVMLTE